MDTFIKNDFVAVLAGENYCTENSNELKEMIPISFNEPEWVQIPPKSDEYYYAVGIAPGYYYEKSSWQEAEKSARFQLASTISVYVESLQLMDPISGQDIKNQEISVILKNISIVSRWIDNKNNFFYVLMRIPKDER